MEHRESSSARRLPRAGGEAGRRGLPSLPAAPVPAAARLRATYSPPLGVAADETDRVVRFSSGWETTAEDWQALTKGVHMVGRELAG